MQASKRSTSKLRYPADYYEYRGSPDSWDYLVAPSLDKLIHREIENIGRDEFGDPLYRIVWGGTCIVREHPDKLNSKTKPRIIGSRDGVRFTKEAEFNGEIIPAHIELRHYAGSSARSKNLCYRTKSGEVRKVARADWAPKGALTWWEYEYWDFGTPRFYIERKLTPEQCLESGYYRIPGQIPDKGDYIVVPKGGTIEIEGQYVEPTFDYVNLIKKALWESINLSPDELKQMDDEKDAKQQAAYEEHLKSQDAVIEEEMVHVLEQHSNKITFDMQT